MPLFRPSSDIRNRYNEISELCHKYGEPIYITKNGQADLAVMSIETYERLVANLDCINYSDEGIDPMKAKNTRPFRTALADTQNNIQKGLK